VTLRVSKNIRIIRDVNRELLAFYLVFVRGAAHVKSTRTIRDVNWEPLAFYTWHCTCIKYKNNKGRQSGAPYFLYVVLHM
jgi:hypothetical protein